MMSWITGKGWTLTAALGLLALFVLANLVLQPRTASTRLDFTERRLYTLTPATRSTLRDLAEPVDITFVYSRRVGQDYPRIRAHAARVREMLESYESLGRGQLRVREIDPLPFSEAEDEALASGITAVTTQDADPLYFGLIGRNTVDDERIMAFLAPEREGTLEYDLTRMISRLDDPALPNVGLLSSLPGMQGDGSGSGYALLRDLNRNYDVKRVPADFASLPEDLDTLMIAHAGDLNDYQTWLIDQFVLRKGRLIWVVDPATKVAGSDSFFDLTSAPRQSDLGALGQHWGVSLAEGAVADATNALPVQTLDPDGRTIVAGQPLFIAAPPMEMSRTDPIVAEIQRPVNLGAPGALFRTDNSPLDEHILISTGPSPSFIDATRAAGEMTPAAVIRAYNGLETPLTLAARYSGELTTAFPNGRPSLPFTGDPVTDELLRAEAASLNPHTDQSARSATIVIIADADLMDDGFYINPAGGSVIADNGTLILNALDALTGIEGLLTLRSRAESLRPMSRVDAMRTEAENEFFDEQFRLEDRLGRAQDELDALQAELVAGMAVGGELDSGLTPEERARLQVLRSEILDTRARLRQIERDFRQDIDGLEATLKAINIWGGAVLVIVFGLGLWVVRRRSVA